MHPNNSLLSAIKLILSQPSGDLCTMLLAEIKEGTKSHPARGIICTRSPPSLTSHREQVKVGPTVHKKQWIIDVAAISFRRRPNPMPV